MPSRWRYIHFSLLRGDVAIRQRFQEGDVVLGGEPVKRLGLDLIDLRYNPRDFLFKGRRCSSRLFRLFALGKSENWRHSAYNKGNGKDRMPIL
jgi:hypothetical protein